MNLPKIDNNIKVHPQQRKIMKAAGFAIHWKREGLIYWTRGNISVTLSAGKPISIDTLVSRCIDQTIYWTKQNTSVAFREFATTNKTEPKKS